jgi:hypothetical protein
MRLGAGPFLNCTELLLLGSPVGSLGRPLLRSNVGPVICLRVFAADSVATAGVVRESALSSISNNAGSVKSFFLFSTPFFAHLSIHS